MFAGDITGKKLSDPFRGVINARDPVSGAGGLNKPSLRVPAAGGTPGNPNYLANRTDTGPVAADPSALMPSNENDYVINRTKAAVLGKSLFWEQQVGSDTVQACGSCHAHAGADNRTKNQMNPNDIGGDVTFEVGQLSPTLFGANHDLVASDFPIHKLVNPEIAGDPKCSPAITATIPAGVLENNFPGGVNNLTVCDKANIANQRPDGTDQNDVASSMGVHFGVFLDIPTPDPTPGGAAFNVLTDGVASLKPDLRSTVLADLIDPIPGFASDGTGTDVSGHQFRRVEPRNTPTVFAAALNFDNFWDGRARHDFNGGSVFGAADPQSHVFVSNGGGALTPTRQLIRFVSIASLATGPGLSQFEMSFRGRNWAKIGKKLLQNGVTPLAEQLVDPTDGVLGPYSNQGGSLCAGLPASDRSPAGGTPTTLGAGVPGLCISYPALIRSAFYPALHNNANRHLNGCYTDGRPDIHPNQCAAGINDPFDGYVLSIANGAAVATDTNQFTQMEGNFSLFWGLSIAVWGTLLLPDNTPFDQFMDANPDMFESIGEVGEPGLVGPMPVCTTSTQRHCFREVPGNNFKRDSSFADPNANNCLFPHAGEGVITQTLVSVSPCKGTRDPNSNAPDPLLGMDIFQGSNFSLKNPNFRAARCAECHAGATLTDNTMPFTHKAQLGDFIGEFITAGNEALVEPLGMTRVITGFLLEDELNSNGQDAIERRIINQSIVPCPTGTLTAGLAFPDGVAGPFGLETLSGIGHGLCEGAGSAFFDNGVYNLGVTICEADQSQVTGRCDDNGRGNTDAFGWPMSLAALLMKNLGGNGGAPCTDSANCSTEPGQPLVNFDPALGNGGGLFEETAQDQTLNPGEDDDAVNPLLPPYLAPFASRIPVGDCMPELDEIHGGINTLTDIAITEGFIDVVGPFNPAGILNESMNSGDGPEMGNWPLVNRVGRFGSIKAAQLREVELTGPYFHNGGKLTLRQVVDFYSRGGDYPITNATHRDFNIVNLTIEKQSNLSEAEKVALVDFLLELTDDRVRFERAPFDHPQAILPLDGTAPENTGGRAAMLAGCVALPAGNVLGPGQRSCAGGMFLDVPATGGTVGNGGFALPNFLGVTKDRGTNGTSGFNCDPASGPISHYCH
jgi:cytochrome c peroxidase